VRYPRPAGLLLLDAAPGRQLATLAGLEGLTRAAIVGVVPLVALAQLGTKEAVSIAYAIGSALTLVVTLNLARLEHIVPRRWILTGGLVGFIAAATLFAFGPSWTIPVAIGLTSAEASIFSVCLSLYIMEYIGKRELTGSESTRLLYLGVVWLAGPALGTWIWAAAGSVAPFLFSTLLAVVVVSFHWYLRLEANPVLLYPNQPVMSPIRAIPRFFGQRNLRVAYAITCIRSIFWASLFVYGPLYVVEAGLPEWTAGVFLSSASGVLFLSPVVRRLADDHGVRWVVQRAFALMALSLVGLTVIGEARPIGVVFWLLGAVGGGTIDVLGNIPFMRLVKPRERGDMAGVFATWREVSFLIAPALAALVLAVGPFPVLYLVLAVIMGLGVVATTFLPRRL